MSAIYLLEEDEECERVWHDKIRYAHRLVWDIGEELEIYTIAPTEDEYNIL